MSGSQRRRDEYCDRQPHWRDQRAKDHGNVARGTSNGANAGDLNVQMGILIGDTNGDGFVNAGDSTQTRNRSGQTTDATNFRSDVTTDGFVNSGDTTAVRARSGTFLP